MGSILLLYPFEQIQFAKMLLRAFPAIRIMRDALHAEFGLCVAHDAFLHLGV